MWEPRITTPRVNRVGYRASVMSNVTGVPAVDWRALELPAAGEGSAEVAARVVAARAVQARRFAEVPGVRVNAEAEGALLEEIAAPDAEGRALLATVAERFGLSARGYHRVLRVARTIADLAGSEGVCKPHIAEAVSFRLSLREAS